MTEKTIFPLTDSKIYTLARTVRLLEGLVPELPTQIAVETDLAENFPREAEDGDATRVLVNYTNARGNSILYKINNHERMSSTVDIDDFLSNFGAFMADTNLPEDPVEQMTTLVLAAMTFAATSVLGIEDGQTPASTKQLAQWYLGAITTVIYDDPLDVVIGVRELPNPSGHGTIPTIVACWSTKQRVVNEEYANSVC